MEFQDTTTPSFQDYVNQYKSPYAQGMSTSKMNDLRDTWAQMYYPNAFQAAMLNYQNEWQKPLNQMLRYQEAGLNPYSFQAQQSASGAQGAKPEPQFGRQQLNQEKISNALKAASTVTQVMSVAKDIYDYLKFGKDRSFYQTSLTKNNADAASYLAQIKEQEMAWSQYWNGARQGYDDEGNDMGFQIWDPNESPRAQYMQSSTQRINAQIGQLQYLTKFLYPSQKDLNEARKALIDYQKEISQGRYDAVLKINTGNRTADSILRMIGMWLLQSSIGIRL